jgi:hypothetical protein
MGARAALPPPPLLPLVLLLLLLAPRPAAGGSFIEPPGQPPDHALGALLRWGEASGIVLNPQLALRRHAADGVGHALFATAPIAAGDVLARIPLERAVHRGSLEAAANTAELSPITRFVLRRSRAQLRQKVGAYGQVFGLAWWLMAAEHGADDVAVPPGWEQYVDALPEEFATALAYEDAELQALAGSAAEPLAHDLRDTFDEEYRVAERAWQRCAELALDEFDAW